MRRGRVECVAGSGGSWMPEGSVRVGDRRGDRRHTLESRELWLIATDGYREACVQVQSLLAERPAIDTILACPGQRSERVLILMFFGVHLPPELLTEVLRPTADGL